MDEHTLKVLEFDKIKRMLEEGCVSELGKELAFSCSPLFDLKKITNTQKETTELKNILSAEKKFPLCFFADIRKSLKKAKLEGTFLEPKELISIEKVTSLSSSLLKFIKDKNANASREKKYPKITELISQLKSFDKLSKKINQTIDRKGEIKDNASSELVSIRLKKKTQRNRLLDRLHSISGSRKPKQRRRDDLITIRNGRYVIPLSEPEYRTLKGIVHDRSASGVTLFVEPLVTVELNNRLKELDLSEKNEIERILKELTSFVRSELKDIEKSLDVLKTIDFIHSKALLSLNLKCSEPIFNQNGYIKLKNAYHPLLATQEKVVPLSLELGKDFYTLVITGPNTGGKTVALKTVGLLVLMAMSGLHIPADFGTEIGIFPKLYADIGDEQSIEASLSTFSSHVLQIIKALKNADEKSLILLDELGAGTDPKEGAALGEVIISFLTQRKAKSVITTHQGALKVLAEIYPDVENASFEFDKKTLKPTYRFHLGFPGASYGVEIASRLGMPENIVKKASELVGSKERDLGVLIEKVQKNLKIVKENRAKLDVERKTSEQLLNLYRDRLKKFDQKRKEEEKKTFRKLQKMVEDARKKIEGLVFQIRKTQAEKQAIKDAQRFLEKKKEDIEKEIKKERKGERIKKKVKIKVGDFVWVDSLSIEGEVLSKHDKSGNVKVRIGNITSIVQEEELSKIDGGKKIVSTIKYDLPSVEEIKPEIDLRGLASDEAIERVDKYLYDSYLAGLFTVNIIHGKGTGVLRKKILEFLKNHPKIESYRLGEWDEGGSGVTVVKLKE